MIFFKKKRDGVFLKFSIITYSILAKIFLNIDPEDWNTHDVH